MSKPLHEQMLAVGAKTAPEPETADEMHGRIARPERWAGLAGVAAVVVGLLKFLPEIAFFQHLHGMWLVLAVAAVGAFLLLFARSKADG